MVWLIVIVSYVLIGFRMLPIVSRTLQEHGVTSKNYLNKEIPNSMGIFIWGMLILYFILLHTAEQMMGMKAISINHESIGVHLEQMTIVVLSSSIIFFVGWFDDSFGRRDIKGFRGHFRHWIHQKTFTSGAIKAIVTGVVSLWVVVAVTGFHVSAVLHFFILILSTNLLNLFDVRPGRSVKMFLITIFVFLMVPWLMGIVASNIWMLIAPMIIPAILVLPGELRQHHMLGDSGANMLGFQLGYLLITACPLPLQILWLFLAGWLHWIAERTSISQLIENNRLLLWLDLAGRRTSMDK